MPHPVSAVHLKIIREEEEKLLALRTYYIEQKNYNIHSDLLQQIYELRSSLQNAMTDDVPHITEQIHNLMNLVNQTQQSQNGVLSINAPYFAHMQLEENRIFNFYLGSSVIYIPEIKTQIIDWKTSPISRIYYLYQPGDEYEEIVADRLREGLVIYKRALTINQGELVRIQQDGVTLEYTGKKWIEKTVVRKFLQGGSGIAIRKENTKTLLGVGGDLSPNKELESITGLLDSEQFKLITQPSESLLAIQGTAGSGKTTVALHRIGWLHSQNPAKYKDNTILVIVFNKALSTYIAKVLPAIGIQQAVVNYFENWLIGLFRTLFQNTFPHAQLSTQITTIRFKKHPYWLTYIKDFFVKKEKQLYEGLEEIARSFPSLNLPKPRVLPFVPFIKNLYTYTQDAKYKHLFPQAARQRIESLLTSFIDPSLSQPKIIKSLFLELCDDFNALEKAFKKNAKELKQIDIEQGIHRITRQYTLLQDKATAKEALDIEDIPLILYLQYLFCGKIMPNTAKMPLYKHIVLDEAQDFCPIEIKILTLCCEKPLSLTFAGDMNQTIQKHNFFSTWENLFETIQVPGKTVSSLQVSYRSTQQIMHFAYSILPDNRQAAKNVQIEKSKQGPPVGFFPFSTQGEMMIFLSEQLSQLMVAEPNASVAVICYSQQNAQNYYENLKHLAVPSLRYIADQEFPFVSGIDVTDVMQVKGLEFDYVILPDINTVNYSDTPYNRFLLHVAATRASYQLWLMTYDTPSVLLPPDIRQ